MSSLTDKIVRLHEVLEQADIPHGFGGALALAWCTQRARGTIDIDLNIFIDTEAAATGLAALPAEVKWEDSDLEVMLREGQVRVWWDKTPIDLFLNTLPLHKQMARRCRWESFGGTSIPFLSCQDIAVLKVFFNRTKDWADLEEMQSAGTLDMPLVTATIIKYLGADDERISKLSALTSGE
ncbi:MAG: hypothetical protein ACI82A_002158 [Candidatus Azotimanducaceae bacterium]|jgi:hypothetical protein